MRGGSLTNKGSGYLSSSWRMAGALPEDLNLLATLDVLLRERHVTRAARRLGLTQSATSQRLARLRQFFEDPLLIPGQPLLLLTPRAEALVGPLSRALAELRGAVQSGAPFEPSTSDRVFVVLGNDLAESRALPVLARELCTRAPGVRIQSERVDAGALQRLGEGTADFAFLPEFLLSPSVRHCPLPSEPFVVLGRAGHLAFQGGLTLDRYLASSHVLVAPHGAPGGVVDRILASMDLRRHVAFRVAHFTSAPALLLDTDLLLTCPVGVALHACASLPLVWRPPPLDIPIDRAALVWHERAHNDPGHRWLRGLFEGMLQRAGALIDALPPEGGPPPITAAPLAATAPARPAGSRPPPPAPRRKSGGPSRRR